MKTFGLMVNVTVECGIGLKLAARLQNKVGIEILMTISVKSFPPKDKRWALALRSLLCMNL